MSPDSNQTRYANPHRENDTDGLRRVSVTQREPESMSVAVAGFIGVTDGKDEDVDRMGVEGYPFAGVYKIP